MAGTDADGADADGADADGTNADGADGDEVDGDGVGRWARHPGTGPDGRDEPAAQDEPDVEPDGSPVVGLVALCDLAPGAADPSEQAFSVAELLVLGSGRRVLLHRDRGLTLGARVADFSAGTVSRATLRGTVTASSLVDAVLTVVLPDDDGSGEPHPWAELAELARARGVPVTADALRRLPYEVVLSERVEAWLRPG